MIKRYLISQFGNPEGLAGWVVGQIMARTNLECNLWAVDLLEIELEDRLLEVGFGPGLAVRAAAGRATRGRVAGVDHSAAMLQHASARNESAILAGRVELQLAAAQALPYGKGQFDKAFAINSYRHWWDPIKGLNEMHRVLGAGGLAAVFEQPRGASSAEDLQNVRREIEASLQHGGFRELRFASRPFKPVPCLAVLGIK